MRSQCAQLPASESCAIRTLRSACATAIRSRRVPTSASCHKIGRLWSCDLACSSRESGLRAGWSSRSRSPTLWPQNTTASVAHAVRLAAAPAAAPSLPWLKYAHRSQPKLRRCRLATRRHRHVVLSVQDDGAKKRTVEEMEGRAEVKEKARQANYLQLRLVGCSIVGHVARRVRCR